MIYGIGIDLIEINRIEKVFKRKGNRFLKKILTDYEIELCPVNRKIEYIAGRFAAKEAVAKALGTGLGKELEWKDIEILNENNGKPNVKIRNNVWDSKGFHTHISISHTKSLAIAKVIIEH